MTAYLLLVNEDKAAHAAQTPAEIAALVAEQARFAEDLRRAGTLHECVRLRPSREGKRARSGGRVDDGPFDDGGTELGGYYAVEAASVDEAAALASTLPVLAADVVDVRPVMKGAFAPDKDARPGKLFAFAVLGSAPNERAWIDIMDRIDADSSRAPQPVPFVGGVRLMPPSAGRHVVVRGERRATLDGPFLEAKEIVGGVTFLRAMTIADAAQWALASTFVTHGALEIRELWRS